MNSTQQISKEPDTEKELGQFIALILRHKPQFAGVTLDEHGWADVDELVAGISRRYPFDRTMLENIVAADEKKRYSFNEDHTKIRANQGHSVQVDVELKKAVPPEILYHGSAIKFEQSIDSTGLISKSRLYVHLSTDYDTAVKVGKRHGEPVIYRVLSGKMAADGFEFFLSENGVWLTKSVPAEYLEKL